jgi:uncharacterized protein (TIRG00374 family)
VRRDRGSFWLVLAIGGGAFAWVLSRADLGKTWALLSASGPLLLLAMPMYLVQIGCDATAWRLLLAKLGARVPWTRLVAVRLSTEAVLMSMPAGGVVAEGLKPYLLRRSAHIPVSMTVATLGAKKALLVLAQACYLALALILGYGLLAAMGTGMPWLVAGGVLFLLALGGALSLAFVRGAVANRVHRLLSRVPIEKLRAWLRDGRGHFSDADAHLGALARRPRGKLVAAYGAFLLAWFAETVETFLLLSILGVDLPIVHILVLEACAVFLRGLAFFVPAGLGVQDAGYLAFFRAYGIPGAADVGAAFVILKRAKELAWIALGYLTLFLLDRSPAPPVAQEVPS